jgi:D-alanyl-D-alanine carboxypeptidase/D-alanyl-D-alanine-endopeptidase (penicillin-binding protein 4)
LKALLAAGALGLVGLWVWAAAESRGAPSDHAAPARDAASASAGPVLRGVPALANERDPALEGRVRSIVANALAKAAKESGGKVQPSEVTVAVHVRELAVPGDLVALHADRPLRPASNLKLVTTAAALALLGPDWSFDTRFVTQAAVANGRLEGDLVVRAAGDPLFDPELGGAVEPLLVPALDALRAAGVRTIAGDLVLDEGTFQPAAPGPAWPSDKEWWKEHCALAAGFSANAGCLTATVRTGDGGRASVAVEPRGHGLPEKLSVRTVGAKSALSIRVGARTGTVIVDGSIPRDVPEWSDRFAVADPVELFGAVLRASLAKHGVKLEGTVVRARRPPPLGAGERELARVSTPLCSVLGPINQDSNNACADQLFLALGHAAVGQGTRAGGRAATALALERLGLPAGDLVQVDGSGLSRDNRVGARQITALVDAVLRRDAESAELFLGSLAVGHASGTLDDRMKDPRLAGRVHAKTGFINGTSSLSGVLDAADGRTLVFSILVEYPNHPGLNQSCWKPMQDALCLALVEGDG